MALYEVAVIYKSEDGEEKFVSEGIETIFADSEELAKLQVARELDSEYDLSEVEIIVRPFA